VKISDNRSFFSLAAQSEQNRVVKQLGPNNLIITGYKLFIASQKWKKQADNMNVKKALKKQEPYVTNLVPVNPRSG